MSSRRADVIRWEMFGRQERAGWLVWGNEIDDEARQLDLLLAAE
jgi:N6-adenosine-specific RNA methylase IME4